MKKNYKIVMEYDGTRYKGWQIQNSTDETIQGKVTAILCKLTGGDVNVIGSGRTDAGVHAKGQVANFHIDIEERMSDKELLCYINRYLPDDIAVKSLCQVDERFHARFSAKYKTYRYRIHISNIANVFERKYVYKYLDEELDVIKMREAAEILKGEHDFKAFCSNRHIKKTTIRTIYDVLVKECDGEIVIDYTGNGFLQGMVRILTGTLIEVGTGKKSVNDIIRALESGNRDDAGFTAPAQGLSLLNVTY